MEIKNLATFQSYDYLDSILRVTGFTTRRLSDFLRNFYEAIRFIVPIHLVRMMLEEAWTKDTTEDAKQQQTTKMCVSHDWQN